MRVIRVRNVNDAYAHVMTDALQCYFSGEGNWIRRSSRAGDVLDHRGPVTTVYEKPRERVLLNMTRDANPFFHLMEALWILAGRGDVAWISQFNSKISQFSDDGVDFHGAYGRRLRSRRLRNGIYGDQVHEAISLLQTDPLTRRCVLTIWSPSDLGYLSKDIPCNTHVYLKIDDEDRLNMTVCCRSNDAIWGCYGANVVHFSVLQEYVAACLDLAVGEYTHVSDSLHIYLDNPAWTRHVAEFEDGSPIYVPRSVVYSDIEIRDVIPLVHEPVDFDDELMCFFADDWEKFSYNEPFFRDVATPMRKAWDAFRGGARQDAVLGYLYSVESADWRIACQRWMSKRYANRSSRG